MTFLFSNDQTNQQSTESNDWKTKLNDENIEMMMTQKKDDDDWIRLKKMI